MKAFHKNLFVSNCLFLLLLFLSVSSFAEEPKFTVVLDAGHGGHDPGAMGMITREKEINLSVTLDLGEIIERNFKDVKVVYTRKVDKYLTLQERADIVNNNHADLFICIHTNASPSASAYGAETFTLGLAKTTSNLEVAKRENSVILLEDDYKTKYRGFDPNSVDSYIMFEFMQDKYIDRSLDMASVIQKQFVNFCSRTDRGVRQAGFWVLHRSACPSVLVELGFISNPSEERYLSSSQGQNEMAKALFNAFVLYKREHDKKSGRQPSNVKIEKAEPKVEVAKQESIVEPSSKSTKLTESVSNVINKDKEDKKQETKAKVEPVAKKETTASTVENVPVYKVQIIASPTVLKHHSSDFKGLKDVQSFNEGGMHKYTVGAETDFEKIEKVRQEVAHKFPKAFIIAFLGEKKITIAEAKKLKK